ncbi:hypothetical protein SKAU_G00243030 [Synaphobranchus kaupii]|uniref:Sema domain-containing protein n=1 Tax=Synaphobranchus kaupii TaxID=118154 RepID=A0A9Q1IU30_SYNKA|nr:hypothetical protein SKAU_G00243030 [Synaphobranchus kaupii]
MTTSPQDIVSPSAPGLLLLFLLLLPLTMSQQPLLPSTPAPAPATPPSPECTRREHPLVSFKALSPWISNFTHPGVRDYSQLTLDLTRNQLIVGARNYLFRLNLSNISLIQDTPSWHMVLAGLPAGTCHGSLLLSLPL